MRFRRAALFACIGEAHAVFVRTPDQAGAQCSAQPVVPNNLVRVWIGSRCPGQNDLVSLLMATMMLEPDRIIFYVDHRFPQSCRVPVPPAMQADHSGDVTDCYTKLGVEIVRIGYGLDNAFGRATQNHTIQRIGKWANGAPRAVVPEFLTDLVRLYALRQVGGFYFDSDVFVTSPELRQWRRCPAVLSAALPSRYDAEVGETALPAEPAELDQEKCEVATRPPNGLNNGGMFMAAGSTTFGDAWWQHYRSYPADWQQWHPYCCYWPHSWRSRHPRDLVAMTDVMHMFPYAFTVDGVTQRNLSSSVFVQQIPRILRRSGTHMLHMTNTKKRVHVMDTVRGMLDWAVDNRGGIDALRPAVQQCVRTAQAWMTVGNGTGHRKHHG